jgi:PAS domain-containing protein
MHDGVYFVNRERKITYWNEGAQGLTGYSAQEIVGKRCFDNFLGHVDESGRPMCTTGCPLTTSCWTGSLERRSSTFGTRRGTASR